MWACSRRDQGMKIPGMQILKKAEQRGNEAEVPVAENLGLVEFFKLTFKEVSEDHVMAFAGVSGAFRSVMEAMNVMYEVEEDRPFWMEYGISIFISLAVIALMLTALGIVVFGSSVGGGLAEVVGLGSVFQTVWSIVQWPILACIVLFAFAVVYYFGPAAKQKWRWISPGSVLAFVFWLVFSLLFSFYVGNFGSYNETYGSLAGVILLMLYIYYSAVIMLVGAEMNQVIEWHIPGGKNEGEKVPKKDKRPNVRPTRKGE